MKKMLMIGAAFSALAGCATTKTLEAVGGSRSDGVVRLAFNYGMFEKPKVDMDAALETARSRCKVWGYRDAEPFGGATSQCQAMNGYGNCVQTMVTVEYQCTGANTPT